MLRPERGFDSRGISLAVAQQSIWWRRAREQAAQLHGGRELATMIEGVADRGGIFLGDNEHVRKHGSADHDRQAGFDVPHVLRLRRRQLRPHRDEAKRAALLLVAMLFVVELPPGKLSPPLVARGTGAVRRLTQGWEP